jgi:hypothetical protein
MLTSQLLLIADAICDCKMFIEDLIVVQKRVGVAAGLTVATRRPVGVGRVASLQPIAKKKIDKTKIRIICFIDGEFLKMN